MSDCRRVIHYRIRKRDYWVHTHSINCLVNEKNEYWRKVGFKKPIYSEVLSKYKNKGIKSIDEGRYSDFSREIFEITLKLIMEDLIIRNYYFAFPCSSLAGKLVMAQDSTYYRPVVIGFKKNVQRMPVRWNIKLSYKYQKRVTNMIRRGHYYPTLKKLISCSKINHT